MTAVSRSHNTIFVHVPKAGGTAVTHWLWERGLIEPRDFRRWYRVNGHKRARDLRDMIEAQRPFGDRSWEDFFSFVVVRNPFDRMISFWHYKRRSPGQKHFTAAVRLSFGDFVRYVRDQGPGVLPPQVDWVLDEEDRIMVDRVVRLDALDRDWPSICEAMGVPFAPLREMNRTHGPRYDHGEYFDDETRAIVESRYARDLALLDFGWVGSRARPTVGGRVVQLCPTLGAYCGIGTYTEHLSRGQGFPAVRELDQIEPSAVQVLHLQHEFGIVSPGLFESVVRWCRESGTRLVVTMHRVERTSWRFLPRVVADALRRRRVLRRAGGLAQAALVDRAPGASSRHAGEGSAAEPADPAVVTPAAPPAREPAGRDTADRAAPAGRAPNTPASPGARRPPRDAPSPASPSHGYLMGAARLLVSFSRRRRAQRRVIQAADTIVVHAADARAELLSQGARDVRVLPHPLTEFPTSDRLHSHDDGLLHVGYFGFLSPAKDLTALIEACRSLSDCRLHLLAALPQDGGGIPRWAETYIDVIEHLDWVELDTRFLPLDQAVHRLSLNDVNVYVGAGPTHGFSSSGSIRQYLAAKRPVVANRSVMVSDLEDVVTVVPGLDPAVLARAIREHDPDTRRIEAYVPRHTWERVPDLYGPDHGAGAAEGGSHRSEGAVAGS